MNKIFCIVSGARKRASALISDKMVRVGLSKEVNLIRGGEKGGQMGKNPEHIEMIGRNS